MLNILYALNGVFYKGGTESVVLNYYEHLDHSKYHIDFLLHGHEEDCRDNEVHNYLLSCGSNIYYVTPRGENFKKNKKEIANLLRNNRYDIVHSHMDTAGYFFLKQAKKSGVPLCVSHSHNTSDQIYSYNFLKKLIYQLIYQNARKGLCHVTDVRIACSHEAGDWLYNGADYIVLNNSVDTVKYKYNDMIRKRVRDELGLVDCMVIGHVGRFSPQKNHMRLIEIFAQAHKKHENARLILVGAGNLHDSIVARISDLGLEKHVLLLGVRNDVNELMQAFDIFLLPSLFEGLPVVGVEAQAAGLPCVISTAVSSEVKLTDNVRMISLASSDDEWCDAIDILYNLKIDREDGARNVENAGFGLNGVMDKLMYIYDNN